MPLAWTDTTLPPVGAPHVSVLSTSEAEPGTGHEEHEVVSPAMHKEVSKAHMIQLDPTDHPIFRKFHNEPRAKDRVPPAFFKSHWASYPSEYISLNTITLAHIDTSRAAPETPTMFLLCYAASMQSKAASDMVSPVISDLVSDMFVVYINFAVDTKLVSRLVSLFLLLDYLEKQSMLLPPFDTPQ